MSKDRKMKTCVVMKRKLFGQEISQKSSNGYFSASELFLAGNKFRIENDLPLVAIKSYLSSKSTKQFMSVLQESHGEEPIKINARNENSHTWVHPYLFIDMALWINPKLKLQVYKWLTDYLIHNRNSSGVSYKEMSEALSSNLKDDEKDKIKMLCIRTSMRIRKECGVPAGKNAWQEATEDQLELRDRIHSYIAFAAKMMTNKSAIEAGIKEGLVWQKRTSK